MANQRLRSAIERGRTSVEEVALKAQVDPKTVHRWLGGRTPHPRHRFVVAKFLHEDEDFLWPGAGRSPDTAAADAEIVAAFPYRSEFPVAKWWHLITSATRQIDLLGYTLYFLPLQHPELISTLQQKCEQGCKIRVAIADPESKFVADRDVEEDNTGLTLVARIRSTLKYFRPLLDCPGVEIRFQDSPLYNSVFRFDDQMLVTPHLYGTQGSAAPLLHLRRLGPNGLFSRFAAHFEAIWAHTTPIREDRRASRVPKRS
jgi:hypothetical protein